MNLPKSLYYYVALEFMTPVSEMIKNENEPLIYKKLASVAQKHKFGHRRRMSMTKPHYSCRPDEI